MKAGSMLAACAAGAAAGAAVTGFAFALALVVPQLLWGGVTAHGLLYAFGNLFFLSATVFISALIVFSIGLLILGLPAWLVLHRAGRRSRADAVIAGSVLSSIVPLGLALATGGFADPFIQITCLSVALAGAVAGWTLHRVAYGR